MLRDNLLLIKYSQVLRGILASWLWQVTQPPAADLAGGLSDSCPHHRECAPEVQQPLGFTGMLQPPRQHQRSGMYITNTNLPLTQQAQGSSLLVSCSFCWDESCHATATRAVQTPCLDL